MAVAEAHALLELSREARLSQNSLATRLQLDKSTVSRIVTLLERRGWVERQRDKIDARIVRVHLTGAGQAASAKLASSRQAKFSTIFAAIPDSKRTTVLNSLDILIKVIRET